MSERSHASCYPLEEYFFAKYKSSCFKVEPDQLSLLPTSIRLLRS